jgi:hypothetical protein
MWARKDIHKGIREINTPIMYLVFAFVLIVEKDTVFIHDTAFFFFLHECAFA